MTRREISLEIDRLEAVRRDLYKYRLMAYEAMNVEPIGSYRWKQFGREWLALDDRIEGNGEAISSLRAKLRDGIETVVS